MNVNKQNTLRCLLVVIAFLMLGACSTLATKIGDPSQRGNSYSGVENSIEHWRCTGQKSTMFFPMMLIVWPVLAVDTVGSAVADTLFLPFDRSKQKKQPRKSPEITHCGANPYK